MLFSRTLFSGLIHGIALSAILFLFIQSEHEDMLFVRMANNVLTEQMNEQEKALKLVQLSHDYLTLSSKLIGTSPLLQQ